jgi:hypothetical protein
MFNIVKNDTFNTVKDELSWKLNFFFFNFSNIMIEKDNGTILMIKMAKMNYLVLVMIFVYIVCYFGWILFLVLGCLYLMFSFMRCASLFVVMSTTISYTMDVIHRARDENACETPGLPLVFMLEFIFLVLIQKYRRRWFSNH